MDLQALKTLIRAAPSHRSNRTVLQAFNQYVLENGSAPEQLLPLSTVAAILGDHDSEVRTYSQHVRFAKQHGLKRFQYRSSKNGRTQTYALDADGVQFTKQ